MKPATAAALQMASAVESLAAAKAWHIWVAATSLSKKEASMLTHATALTEVHGRQELLIGLTLLIWGQEKALAFARTALIAWCKVALCAARDADVAALASDRAMLEEGNDWEQRRRLVDVDNLVNRVFLDNESGWC